MPFDLFSVDVLDEDIDRFKRYSEPCIIEGSLIAPKIAVVPNETFTPKLRGIPCFTPHECRFLLGLTIKEAKALRDLKLKFGGTLKE